ncbi:hypothetical protein [Pseudomonas sp. WAC2]|uniref:hypothetical protein n=1 Tax=Pseudomonas sp. WAC2 TaxID=3055057 RepID=UPI0025B1599F|nr:hypothetical protein [Pseudomonas sp. WAC2]MDN3235621.1 hypothetical protein [Pseudomonas sp. WAC2]
MKIAQPILPTPSHVHPEVQTPPHAPHSGPTQTRPGVASSDEKGTHALAKEDAALAQEGQTASRRDQSALSTGLQSQAYRLQLSAQQLHATYLKGLDKALGEAAQSLRKQLKDRQLQNSKETLKHILESCGGNAVLAHQMLRVAARQARNEGEDSEQLLFRRQFKLLYKEYGKPARPSTSALTKARGRFRAETQRRTRSRTLHSVTANGPLNVIALVDALLNELREQGQYELSLSEIRSEMAEDIANAASTHALHQARPLISNLTIAKHVAALLHECEHVLGRMREKNPQIQVEAIALLRHLLTLMNKLMEPEQTLTLVQLIGGEQLKHQLSFLNELMRILTQRLSFLFWRNKSDFHNVKENLLILSTKLTDEEQQRAQETDIVWNL